uniref:Uncharacterized protein n=1 Tax=Peronospora matthiolae TaxID=2874970 RepID=A0AAV1TSV7_9STRA
MDEVAFVESLFSPEMRSSSGPTPSSVYSSPLSSSCGRVKTLNSTGGNSNFNHNINSLVPAPPNSLLGGGIALSQLHAPFQPLTADDAPLFVRLHDDDVFSQMLNDQDFPDFASGLKREHDSSGKLLTCSPTTSLLLEPLELPRLQGDVPVKDSGVYSDIMSFQQSSFRPRRSGILPTTAGPMTTPIGHGYTVDTCNAQLMAGVSSTMSAPIGFDPTSGGGTFVSYAPLAAHPWMQEEVSTPMSALPAPALDEDRDGTGDRGRGT